MAEAAIYLLGPFHLEINGSEIQLSRRKAVALLSYLAMTRQDISRDSLTELLYPGRSRTQAQSDFRTILWYMRDTIGSDWLRVNRSMIGLRIAKDLWIDVHEFHTLLKLSRQPETLGDESRLTHLLGQAESLYRGEFLAGFYLKDSPAFEDWQFYQKDTLQKAYASILKRLVEIHSSRGEFDLALDLGHKWLNLDPLDEAVHRHLMRLYIRSGKSSSALKQYERCKALLSKELGETPDEETEDLYEAIRSSRLATTSGYDNRIAQINMVPGNLPVYRTPIIGRERESTEISNLLLREEIQILILTGTGGAGKTRLAVQIASELGNRFDDGVFFVDLAPIREPAYVITSIARTVGVREYQGKGRPLSELLKYYLKRKRLLLVLDTFEHLKPALAPVQQLLLACPSCKALVTSRESLQATGISEYQVLPLDLPDLESGSSPESLNRFDAARLFVARAHQARSDFLVSAGNAATVAEICRRLDGLPLAIELAAPRLKILSVEGLLGRLTDRFKILRRSDDGLPFRQQTLQRTIEWSYELLNSGERRLFACLSVFKGGCTPEAAESVCTDPGENIEIDVLEGLTSLLDKNLLFRREINGEVRISMLDTIREYSELEFQKIAETEKTTERHARFYLGLAEAAEPRLHGPDQMKWLERLERDNENLNEAMNWFLSSGKALEACRLGAALRWFWTRYGHLRAGTEEMEKVLALAESIQESIPRARALHTLGWLVFLQGYWSRGYRLYRESLNMFRRLGDRKGEGMVLSDLGLAQRWLGNSEEGTRHVEEAVLIARAQGDPLRLAISLIWAYSTTGGQFEGKAPQAELEEALELSRQVGNLWSLAHAHQGLGDMLKEIGEYAEARLHYKEALKGFRELKDRLWTAWTLEGLGRTQYLAREYRSAEFNFQKSLALFDILGDRGGAILVLRELAMLTRALGHHRQAATLLGAYTSNQKSLIGQEAAARLARSPELIAALNEYESGRQEEWLQGKSMGYEQAVAYARQISLRYRFSVK